jgi:hypothetical protein
MLDKYVETIHSKSGYCGLPTVQKGDFKGPSPVYLHALRLQCQKLQLYRKTPNSKKIVVNMQKCKEQLDDDFALSRPEVDPWVKQFIREVLKEYCYQSRVVHQSFKKLVKAEMNKETDEGTMYSLGYWPIVPNAYITINVSTTTTSKLPNKDQYKIDTLTKDTLLKDNKEFRAAVKALLPMLRQDLEGVSFKRQLAYADKHLSQEAFSFYSANHSIAWNYSKAYGIVASARKTPRSAQAALRVRNIVGEVSRLISQTIPYTDGQGNTYPKYEDIPRPYVEHLCKLLRRKTPKKRILDTDSADQDAEITEEIANGSPPVDSAADNQTDNKTESASEPDASQTEEKKKSKKKKKRKDNNPSKRRKSEQSSSSKSGGNG